MDVKIEGTIADSGEIRQFRRALRGLEREIEYSLSSQTECCGVTIAQCHLLLELDHRGPSSIGELALALELDPSTLSRTVDGLVKSQMATRADDPANRRRQIVELLPAGRAKVAAIDALCDVYYATLLDKAPPALKSAIGAVVAYLAEGMRAARCAGASCCTPLETTPAATAGGEA